MRMRMMMFLLMVCLVYPAFGQTKGTTSKSANSKSKNEKTDTVKKNPIQTASKSKSENSDDSKSQKNEEKLKANEIEFSGMVEVSSFKNNEPQGLSVWTVFPVVKDDVSRTLLKSSHKMMKIKGQLVEEKPGKWVLKIKKAESIEEAPLDI